MDSEISARDENELRETARKFDQGHIFRFWNELDDAARARLSQQVGDIDFPFMHGLIERWVRNEPPPETFDAITPIPVIPPADPARPDARAAFDAGEAALRAGRVGIVIVAGGQGTRLGFDGPKGAYPIGPVTRKTIFEYHAERIRAVNRRYACALPLYLMVSDTNEAATRAFFREHAWFGLNERDVLFFRQRMVPCVDTAGRFLLDAPDHVAANPNGHGGCIPALVDNGCTKDARARGVDTLYYFQVDNWAVNMADPYFIGYHVLGGGEMSSKVHRKEALREGVGVHCICDGEYRVIEYSELDLYPQLLETDDHGAIVHYAGNPAMHILDVGFVERIAGAYDRFPWHRAFKKIPFLDDAGDLSKPDAPNGYKFETFIFDALRYITHAPIALEIRRAGEYTPIKDFDGVNSVRRAWREQNAYWAGWIEAAGCPVPRDERGDVSIAVEISPLFALTRDEFIAKSDGRAWPTHQDLAIDPRGEVIAPRAP